MLKAAQVAAALGMPAIADDSGIEVDALGGAPGASVGAVRGRGGDRRAEPRRPACERCGACRRAAAPRGTDASPRSRGPTATRPTPTASARARSSASGEARGGFGYDPVFVPAGWDETMAELTDEQKDRISHRGRAFRALGELLDEG